MARHLESCPECLCSQPTVHGASASRHKCCAASNPRCVSASATGSASLPTSGAAAGSPSFQCLTISLALLSGVK
eukprot:4635841-Prymnesium_polylepis.2